MRQDIPTNVRNCIDRVERELASHELFYGHGTDSPGSEAMWLVTAVLERHGREEISEESMLTPAELEQITRLVQERVESRKPLAYLLREAWFAGHRFYVDERVLVPRSPMAELIENSFEPLIKDSPRTILDLCCGSGCIGIACAMAFTGSRVVLADNSEEALEVADENISGFRLNQRVETRNSDVFENIPEAFDLIVANPPYVSDAEYRVLPVEYHREPAAGLVTGQQGLDIPLQILARAADHLHEDGLLVLETGHTWQLLERHLPRAPFLWLDFANGGEGVCALTQAQLAMLAAD